MKKEGLLNIGLAIEVIAYAIVVAKICLDVGMSFVLNVEKPFAIHVPLFKKASGTA
jgi:hypothetical protein